MKLDYRYYKKNQRMVLIGVASYLVFRYIFSTWDAIETLVGNLID
jgi:hypothetical protein